MRLISFGIGVVICLVIIVVGILWIGNKVSSGGAALGLGVGGLADVIYLFVRNGSGSVAPEITDDGVTLWYRVQRLDSMDTIVCIVVLVVTIGGGIAIWH